MFLGGGGGYLVNENFFTCEVGVDGFETGFRPAEELENSPCFDMMF